MFYSWVSGSFAKSSVVDLRRQTVRQIQQNSVRLNDILLCRLANRKENSGGSALKPRVFRQISRSVSRTDPLKCLLSSRGAPGGNAHTHTHAYTQARTLRVKCSEGIKQHAPVCIAVPILAAPKVRIPPLLRSHLSSRLTPASQWKHIRGRKHTLFSAFMHVLR